MNNPFPADSPQTARINPARRLLPLLLMASTLVTLTSAVAASSNDPEVAKSGVAAAAASPARAAGETPADLAADATYLLPGLLRKDSSLDTLRRRFGAEHVKAADIDGAEGETLRGIVLFADDPLRRAEIFPQDDTKLRGIASIRISGKQSRWHLDNGVHLGMTLAELAAANGKAVTFSGLDWDYGGSILDWHGGRLAPRDGDTLFRSVVLSHDEESQANRFPLGDGEFRSDDRRYPQQGKALFVGQLTLSFIEADGD
ncbi:hypothetical protein DFR29_104209 [Tahibacter aquaticus]|uniref:Uncharacterized protein n=1 Tax=Tahibacter aquaticus TaxID=520092 RepID=A0A4R6Z2G8_9GAMM|nr:hypothetical protein [Tahibacter aquaticus]TDR45781.1 hypothetical protein DFR29_104209 [Tahibacter aquaticus]